MRLVIPTISTKSRAITPITPTISGQFEPTAFPGAAVVAVEGGMRDVGDGDGATVVAGGATVGVGVGVTTGVGLGVGDNTGVGVGVGMGVGVTAGFGVSTT